MKVWFFVLALAGLLGACINAAEEVKYSNDFEKAEIGSLPDEFLVLDGAFTVKEDSGNKVLELPGAPLDSFGILFGPTLKENLAVSARFFGTGKGRRFPTFAIGLNGVGGYKLRVSPGKKQLELYRGDNVKTAVAFDWPSGKWTHLKLTLLKKSDSAWTLEGRAWPEGGTEPAEPTLSFEDKDAPPTGRQMISASPYAGTPILFDDLRVAATK